MGGVRRGRGGEAALLLHSERKGMLEALNRGMLLSLWVLRENVATHFSKFLKVQKSRILGQCFLIGKQLLVVTR